MFYFLVVHSTSYKYNRVRKLDLQGREKTILGFYKKVITNQKGSIILNHFTSSTSKKINGRGRGMVVVRSRKHCVPFHKEMVRQMKNCGGFL